MNTSTFSRQVAAFASLRGAELSAAVRARLSAEPRCPVARYLAAGELMSAGRPAPAVRHLMVAYHAEPDLESAALLVFAGLNWTARPNSPLLPVLLATWEEFRRPAFDRRRRERILLDAFDESARGGGSAADSAVDVGGLARRLYRLPIESLRAQVREAAAARTAALYPLLLTPA